MKLTLGQARQELYLAVVPNLDSQANIDLFNQYLNWAQERLINSGKWNGMISPVRFNSPDRIITLPRQFLSVLAAKWGKDNCTGPLRVQNVWYSYLAYFPNFAFSWSWNNYGYYTSNIYDQGDGYVTFKDVSFASYRLRVTITDANDVGTEVLIKANNESGNPTFSTNGEGQVFEGIVLTAENPSTTSAEIFSGQPFFVQKEQTIGYLILDAVDIVTGDVERIGYYQPSEEDICYRRYSLRCDLDVDTIDCMVKRRYVPALVDSDEVWPANLGALRNCLAALKAEKELDLSRYQILFNEAIKLLNDEIKESRGGAQYRMQIDPLAFQSQNIQQRY